MRIQRDSTMTQLVAAIRRSSTRATGAFVFAGALLLTPIVFSTAASAQALGYASSPQVSFPADSVMTAPDDQALTDDGDGSASNVLPERLRRAVVNLDTREAPGTVIIDTGNTALYYVLGRGQAIRYGVGVGRQGFTWAGTQTISRKAEWPDWHPPAEMIARQPYLPRFMAGGPGNPLGARAMYLGSSEFVSSGCIRLTNEDVADLFSRVDVGTKVVVLPKNGQHIEARAATPLRAAATSARPAVTVLRPGREAMNIPTSSTY
jgi:lipoprotein-anchoring transpeptidase ErfK/SrfK